MKYNFDVKIDRSNNDSVKWQEIDKNFKTADLLPMWIADMDFPAAPEIIVALKDKVNQQIFGYVHRAPKYFDAVSDWSSRRFNYKLDSTTLSHSPNVVTSISILISLFTKPHEKIIINTPVYPQFKNSILNNKREVITSELKKDNRGYYTIDFEDFERKISDKDVSMFILCSPHNPVGRVWKIDELQKLLELCSKHNVLIISDEIWRDLILKDYTHIPTVSLCKESKDNVITCFSATKTFNLAGLEASFVSFNSSKQKSMFDEEIMRLNIANNNAFSLVACEAAYTQAEKWLDELLEYLEANMDYVIDFLNLKLPHIKVFKPEGTYLMWLDFSNFKLSSDKLSSLLQEKAKIALSNGLAFGQNSPYFRRLNIATPRYILKECLERLESAFKDIE